MPVSSWDRTADALVGASILLAGLTGPWAAHVLLLFFPTTWPLLVLAAASVVVLLRIPLLRRPAATRR